MKKILLFLLSIAGSSLIGLAHGPGYVHRNQAAEVDELLDEQGPPPESQPTADPAAMSGGKSFRETVVEESEQNWGAALTTGWEGRHVHYGVDETGNSGAWTSELGLWIGDVGLSFWNGFGLGNDFEKWNFTASYMVEAAPVFLIPGYNFRYLPEPTEEPHEGEHGHDEHEADASHAHLTYNNELFAVIGTNTIPYVTPSVAFIWNLNDAPGGFLEFRVDGDVPVWKNIVTLNPYALLGLNFGYNTTAAYGLNNFQLGIQADWQVNEYLTAFVGVNYSLALEALDAIGQGNEVWANAGVSVGF